MKIRSSRNCTEGFAGYLRDDQAEQHVGGIAVRPTRPGGELRLGLTLEQRQHFFILNLMFRRPLVRVHRIFVIGQARRVGEQVAHGDGARVWRKVRGRFGQRLVVAEFAVVDQEHDGHGGELLGERREAEIRVGIDLRQRSQIADAVAALEDRRPSLRTRTASPGDFAPASGAKSYRVARPRPLGSGTAGKQEERRAS